MANVKYSIENIPREKFAPAGEDRRITDKKFDTKPVGYFKDAYNRFKKNKSSLAAAVIIMILFLFALIVPFTSNYDVNFRDEVEFDIIHHQDVQILHFQVGSADVAFNGL